MNRTTGLTILALGITACGPAVAEQESDLDPLCDPSVEACAPEATEQESGEDPQCDPWIEACEVTMYPTFGTYVLLDVEQAQTMAQDDEAGPLPLEDQFVRASIGRYLVLQSDADVPSVCLLPDAFESLSEVPTDASSCDCTERAGCWSSIAYLGLINAEPGEYTGAGFFLKANGGDLYRGRVIEAVASSEVSTLSIEYQRVME